MAIAARAIEEIYPATPSQQGFVLGSLGRPKDALFVEQAVLPLSGPLDPQRLGSAWSDLVAAHEILRTAFALNLSSAPRQVVLSRAETNIECVDAPRLAPDARDAVVGQALAAGRAPFDPAVPPLVRLTLIRFGSREHTLVWSHHHAVLDGWSQMRLVAELVDRCNRPHLPRSVPHPFGSYAVWLADRDAEGHRAFWRQRLSGFVPPEPLPVVVRREDGERFGTAERELAPGDAAPLHAAAAAAGVTTATALLACWSLVAARLRAAPEIAIGVTVSGRSGDFPGLTEMIGPLVGTIPQRFTVDTSRDVTAWLAAVQADVGDALSYSDAAAGEIHAWSDLPPGRPLYDSVFAVANYPAPPSGSGPLTLRADGVTGHGGRTLLPLAVVVSLSGALRVRVVNDRGRVDDGRAADAADGLIRLAEALGSAEPGATVGALAARLEGLGSVVRGAVETRAVPSNAAGTLEDLVAQAFAHALGHSSVPPDGDLIQLGGHSVLALGLLGDLRERFGVDLDLRDLFADPTPRGTAARIGELLAAGRPAPEPLPGVVADPGAAGEPFPLTEIQQAYWAGRQAGFELSGVDAHLYGEIDVPNLDRQRFGHAWRRLVARHPMLRAVMTADGRQVVLSDVPPYEPAHTETASNEECARLRARLSHARRDVTRWPLFTIETAGLPDGATRVYVSFDLLIGDALSWRVLLRELTALYDEPAAELPPLELTFRDYVMALAGVRGTRAYARAREYWHSRLPELPAPPAVPRARSPAELDEIRFERRQATLEASETEALRSLAGRLGTTVSTVLLTAFAHVLRRFSDGDDLLVNVTLFNRLPLHPDVDRVVGDFTSLLLVAVTEWQGSFAERVRALQRRVWSDLDHRLYSGLAVMRDMAASGARGAAAPIVFTSTLDLPDQGVAVPGTVTYAIGQTPQVALDYQVYESAGRLVVNWDAVGGLFPDGLLDAMFAEHAAVLRRLAHEPDAAWTTDPLTEAPAPPAVGAPLGGPQRLHDPFVEQARRRPDATAVIDPERRLTYGELLERAGAVAAAVQSADPEGSLVAIVMEKGLEQVVAAVATLLAGRAYVPVDARWPPARIDEVLRRTRCSLVLSQGRVLRTLPLPEGARAIAVDAEHAADGSADGAAPADGATAEDLAYVIFTSGSTGRSKGVMIQHAAALNTVLDVNARFGVGPADRVLALSSLAFDLSVYDVFGTLAAGACIVVPPERARRDPRTTAALTREHAVTVWNSVPVLMRLLLSALPSGDTETLGSLRLCMLSGDWIPLDLPDAVRKHAPAAAVVSLGGATEGAIWSIAHEVGKPDPGWTSIPYGRAMTGQTVEVLDHDLRPRPAWVPGEIHIGGHGVALGYWDDPEQTTAAFLSDPRTGGRLYRTGDWGRSRPDGVIEFLGRRDDQVKVGGHRIELAEIEAALRRVPGVEDAAVVAPGPREDRRLVAFFTGDCDPANVREHLRSLLPEAMVPPSLQRLDALPLSATAKVDRRRLAELCGDAAAAPASAAGTASSADMPDTLRAIVERVVGAPVSAATDLLASGLDSIEVIRMLNTIEAELGVRPDIDAFYRDPTVGALAATISSDAVAPAPRAIAPESSVWTRWPQLQDPEEQVRFRRSRPAFPPPPERPVLGVARPVDAHRLARRRAYRRFDPRPVPAERLAALLACLRRAPSDGRSAFLYPSAGGLYAVRAYVHVRPDRVEEVAPGLFWYHPDAADLVPVAEDVELDRSAHLGTVNRPVAEAAAFTILLVTDPADSAPLYGPEAEALSLLDAGYVGQLLCDTAIEAGLGLCPLHGFDFDAIRWLFPGGERAVLLHLLAGGVPEDAP